MLAQSILASAWESLQNLEYYRRERIPWTKWLLEYKTNSHPYEMIENVNKEEKEKIIQNKFGH